MIAIYLSQGDTIDYTPGADVAAGDVVDFGDFVGIAFEPIPSGQLGALRITGRFKALKKTGETWEQGEPVYWDVGTETFSNNVSYSEAVAGLAAADAASGDATGEIILTPGVARS